jgi:NADH:ubiquinone oxidoreductase subunit K
MNNPFKIIGIAFLSAIAVLSLLTAIPKVMPYFKQMGWLATIAFAIIILLSILLQVYRNAHKINNQHLTKNQSK